MQDDIYDGYHLPGGSTVIGNSFAISRDPEYFPDGDTFRPERYMPGPERDHIMAGLAKGHTSFGFGRYVYASVFTHSSWMTVQQTSMPR